MKTDRFKNKRKSTFIPEKEKHGKKEIRHVHKEKSKVRTLLRKMMEVDDFDESDDLTIVEKMG